MNRPRFLPDNFTLAMIATVVAASLFPCHGQGAVIFNGITHVGVSLLFFLHGAKLSREAVIAGVTHWRLHLLVLLCTFALFPLLGLLLKPVLTPLVTPDLYLGILFLCMLPSTVQSSIAFTAAARGNVPAAICSASASNLFGIFITPLLVGLLTSAQMSGGSPLESAGQIALQLLLPFIAGQVARRWIGAWVEKHKPLTRMVDQGSILLVVYTAFSEAVGQGLWHQVSWGTLAGLMLINVLLLGLVMGISAQAARRLGFNREDRIAIVFCGSKKSLASGVPMAKVLFAGGALGAVVLPLMLFHQLQLMVCAVLAQRYAKEAP
ncbi:solute carrier family 10 (sodium/bile acid cotransporter), member 7 [Duganella sp. CF402]|uniref:bile acid:sodium symporter family protein n=1 Tax=unclassified Duganella TaxID=2636909 RepID=UPI0008C265AD|nr:MULTISPECIES: bile acid:sodium symporter family protein [unclassified Duganella]RZT09123.1 sodium/bile acid cotransporter 7 [Duganella sp. BK701]SEL69553.1 solute carrier family 10 (sodium/bile acid cotransporter), member 7 [Duganella sp. CF402]